MSIHPILLRAMLTAIVAEITQEQREALSSADDGIRIAAEDDLVNGIILAMVSVDSSSGEARTSLTSH